MKSTELKTRGSNLTVLRDLKAGDFFKFLDFVNIEEVQTRVPKFGIYLGFSHVVSISLASTYVNKFHPEMIEQFRSNYKGEDMSLAQFNCVVNGCIRFIDTDTRVAKLTVKGKT